MNAADTHETFHRESGMRYQHYTPYLVVSALLSLDVVV
jgi:hypothetical protein